MPVNFDFNNPPSLSSLIALMRGKISRRRRGSILILVIALLVLMAIIGTAALSTNTTDRFATQQNSVNTEIDLLLQGVKNMAAATLVGDLKDRDRNGAVVFRPGVGNGTTYENTDAVLNIDLTAPPLGMDPAIVQQLSIQNDAWLSPRYPALVNQGPGASQPALTTPMTIAQFPVWDALGAPLENPNGIPSSGQSLYDTPGVWDPALNAGAGTFDLAAATGFNYRVTARNNNAVAGPTTPAVIPTYINYTLNGRGVTVPALQFAYGTVAAPARKFIAADADGDGLADSALRKLQIGEQNGLTYYYAVRIIDNGAAVNVNTAWDRDHDSYGDLTGPFVTQTAGATTTWVTGQFFPSSVGLAQLLSSYNRAATNLDDMQRPATGTTELGNIDRYRFNALTNAVGSLSFLRPSGVVQSTGSNSSGTGSIVVDAPPGGSYTAAQRNDFAFTTLQEMLSTQLSRRLNYPGQNINSAGTGTVTFQRFTASDSAALAYHFVIPNPSASLSLLETAVKNGGGPYDSLMGTSGTSAVNLHGQVKNPYENRKDYGTTTPTAAAQSEVVYDWFNDNFNWDKELLLPPGGTYVVDDFRAIAANSQMTAAGLTTFTNRRSLFTADNPVSNQMPGTISGLGALTPTAFVRASVNTGTLGELQGSFLAVMSEGGLTPYENVSPKLPVPELMYAYTGSRFVEPAVATGAAPSDQKPTTAGVSPNDTNPYRMFRNVIRDNHPTNTGNNAVTFNDASGTVSANAGSTLSVHMQPGDVRKLRANIAAANAITMRGSAPAGGVFPIAANPTTGIKVNIAGAPTDVDVLIYPADKQPYITEVYVNTDVQRTAADSELASTSINPPPPTTNNAEPYVAIELHWPYEAAAVATAGAGNAPNDLTNWCLATIDRSIARSGGAMPKPVVLYQFKNTDTVVFPATTAGNEAYGSYILLENYDDAGTGPPNGVTYRPRSTGLPFTGPIAPHTANEPPVTKVYVKDLGNKLIPATGTASSKVELVLIKSRTQASSPADTMDFGRPIDSFDFTGLVNDSGGLAHVWHYARSGYRIDGGTTPELAMGAWRFVYPGRYDGGKASRRHQGIQVSEWNNATQTTNPYTDPGFHDPFLDVLYVPNPTLGMKPDTTASPVVYLPAENGAPGSSYPNYFTTQILNVDQPGWNKLVAGGPGTPNKFPYGAFARNVDILQVPFAAAYRIRLAGTQNDVEINSLPMDMSFCEDTDDQDDESAYPGATPGILPEQVGRFCPVITPGIAAARQFMPVDDTDPAPEMTYRYSQPTPLLNASNQPNPAWRYRWATRLFDYVTVQDPASDFSPNRDPVAYAGAGPAPVPVSNEGGTAGDPRSGVPGVSTAENTVPLHGLININTAPWRVLATINWTPFAANDTANRDLFSIQFNATTNEFDWINTPNQIDDNIDIAKAIAWWRDGVGTGLNAGNPVGPKGPFQSVYDLYRIPFLRKYYLFVSAGQEPDDSQGDFSPYNPTLPAAATVTTDGVRGDFEEKFLVLNRVSNLITTRSDSFTVYITVQGWRGVGTANPEMVVQRRAAFIADRSSITATGGQLKVINVPTE